MEDRNTFYVVRKANMVAVYRRLSDCQAQLSSSVSDPAVSVYKGHSLCKETKEYIASRGLKNALYTMDVADVKEDLFGDLVPCYFQDVNVASAVSAEFPNNHMNTGCPVAIQQRSQNPPVLGSFFEARPLLRDKKPASSIKSHSIPRDFIKPMPIVDAQPLSSRHMACILEFDGASKDNPGKAGAGAVIRTQDGRVISRLREGLGVVTNNVAEYRALILGMKHALRIGFRHIHVQGDSQLICMQVQGLWQTKHPNMVELCKEVNELKQNFLSFNIIHVKRGVNSDADAQAIIAIDLPVGEVYEERGEGF